MKYVYSLLFSIGAMALSAQAPIKNAEQIINAKCLGSSSNTEKQTVHCRVITTDSIEIVTETSDLKTGKRLRKNIYLFNLKQLDAEKTALMQFDTRYGVNLYSKEGKSIRQSALLNGDSEAGVFQQDKLCISEFKNIQDAENLQQQLIKAIKQSDH